MLAPSETGAEDRPAGFFAYGVALEASFALPVTRASEAPLPVVRADLLPQDELLARWSGPDRDAVLVTRMSDGVILRVVPGIAGDHLVHYGDRGLFLISPDTATLSCSRSVSPADPGWSRVLLDWVMYFIASLRGTQALHASAAVIGGRVSAFCALSGGGKTSVVLDLVASGAELMCDDVLCLDRLDGVVAGQPGVPFVNLVDTDSAPTLPGSPLGLIGDERWMRVPRAALAPVPIGTVFLLDRSDRHDALRAVDCSLFAVRQHAVGLPHLVGAEMTRFALLADLMTQATVRRIEAPTRASATDIAHFAAEVSLNHHARAEAA